MFIFPLYLSTDEEFSITAVWRILFSRSRFVSSLNKLKDDDGRNLEILMRSPMSNFLLRAREADGGSRSADFHTKEGSDGGRS